MKPTSLPLGQRPPLARSSGSEAWSSASELLPARILSKIADLDENGCRLWTGYTHARDGYGLTRRPGDDRTAGARHVHRVVFEILVGEIGEGLVLDHLCRVRSCVEPGHLEPVTLKTNVLRGVGGGALCADARAVGTCRRGHPWTPENTGMSPSRRGPYCKACQAERARARRALTRVP